MAFGRNQFNCECGGLRHICSKHGCLPGSLEHYTYKAPESPQVTVVWSGELQRQRATAIQLIPSREEHPDNRLSVMQTYDLDDGETANIKPHRKYTLTGKHVGKCSRTNPNAPQYIPTRRGAATVLVPSTAASEDRHG